MLQMVIVMVIFSASTLLVKQVGFVRGKRIAAVGWGCLQPAISKIDDLGHRTGSLQYPCERRVATI